LTSAEEPWLGKEEEEAVMPLGRDGLEGLVIHLVDRDERNYN
jgi:hypothetical protein